MSESAIMREIQMTVSKLGHRVFRNNVGFATTRNGCNITYGLCVGSSDLIGWTSAGRFLAIEVKTKKGVLRTEQIKFLDAVNKSGGIGFVANSTTDVIERLSLT